MRRKRKADRELNSTLEAIKESSRIIAKNTEHTNEKLDELKNDVGEIKKSSTSRLPIIISIIIALISFSGITGIGIYDRWKTKTQAEVKTDDDKSEPESETEYKIYLYPEYTMFQTGMEIEMTVSLNFETDAVIITAHLASGGEDTVNLIRKNETEWQNKVVFTETGIHEIVVTATAPSGEIIENSVEVEVTPVSIDMDIINQFFHP